MRGGLCALAFVLSLALAANAFVGPPPATPVPTPTPTPLIVTPEPLPEGFALVTATPSPTPGPRSCDAPSDIRERIRCRVRLPETHEARSLPYTPEECRRVGGAPRQQCLANYDATAFCFTHPADSAREACARGALGLRPLAEMLEECRARTLAARDDCLQGLRTRWFWVIKFRIYNLEYKAQELIERGVSEDLAVDFIALLEQKKIDFTENLDFEPKKRVLREVAQAWAEFRSQAIAQIRAGGGSP
jgi:hypothetical protein